MIAVNTAAESLSEKNDKTLLGFWIYLMTDCVLFATLFATYIVLKDNTFGLPPISEITSLNYVLAETIILLTSSFTIGLALLAASRQKKAQALNWLMVTFILGGIFLAMEIAEFIHLFNEGYSWTASASMSAYFTLLGTHGLHITAGLIWLMVIIAGVVKKGLNINLNKITMLGIFWHFLDIIWIFIFSIVFLIGVA